MPYKCYDCEHIFEEWEVDFRPEDGEPWETRFSSRIGGCPICKGAYDEAVRCKKCKSYYFEHELNGGVCDDCIDEYRKDFDSCYKFSVGEKTEIEINSLLASLFDVSDIEQILKEYIREKWQDVSCGKFIDEDTSWFGEKIAEEVEKNE